MRGAVFNRPNPSRSDWAKDALCARTDPELFFPTQGGTCGPAKAICARCPAKEACLREALALHPVCGVWGMTSEVERHRLMGTRPSMWSVA